MTDKRRESVLQKIGHSLAYGFKPLEVSVLSGHLDLALLATAGKASKSFARTVYLGIVGPASDQPAPVYRALQWLAAIMQRPPPRIERTKFAKHHILLPKGNWDPPKKEGGVGAVLLREGDLPYTRMAEWCLSTLPSNCIHARRKRKKGATKHTSRAFGSPYGSPYGYPYMAQ